MHHHDNLHPLLAEDYCSYLNQKKWVYFINSLNSPGRDGCPFCPGMMDTNDQYQTTSTDPESYTRSNILDVGLICESVLHLKV